MPLRLSFLTIYNALCVYMIPISLTVLIYFKLVRYVREMSKHVTTANTLFRAQRELKMVRRSSYSCYWCCNDWFSICTMLIFISFFTTPPKYHFRIAYIFVDVSLAFVMVVLFQFTDQLKTSITKRIHGQANVILPAIA